MSSKSESFKILEKENITTQIKIKEYFLNKYNTKDEDKNEIESLYNLEKSQREMVKIMSSSTNPKIETNDKDYVFISYIIKYFPKDKLNIAHHWLILHGRYVCLARSPKCEKCGITDICKYFDKHKPFVNK